MRVSGPCWSGRRSAARRFETTATIGRQSLAVPMGDLAAWARRLGIAEPDWDSFAVDGYSEDFFRKMLGAKTVTSFDFSAYQGAGVVHDFNQPLPPAYPQPATRSSTAAPSSTSSTSSRY